MECSRQGYSKVALALVLVLSRCAGGHFSEGDLGRASLPVFRAPAIPTATTSPPAWHTGTLVVRTISLIDGNDGVAVLLREPGQPLRQLDVGQVARQFESILPGTLLRVLARDLGPNALLVLQFLVITPAQDGSSPGSSSQSGSWDDQSSSGSSSASTKFSIAALAGDLAAGSPWVQNTAVTSVPTLFMIAGMCNSPAATVPSELEKVLFNVPGSRAKTLQSYYSECSQGMASLNSTNSRVVGPITIPCSYSSDSLSFSTESCEYSDTDGWIQYASQQAASLFGVDLSLYKHRVLIMPMYYIYDAGCSWMGLGTLGPDATGPNGEYLYSSVWITGEYWRQVMAYMHELGHTNYLHHSAMGSCDYCDYTCPMGGCCDTRCFNPPHNWQLGWGSPIVTLNAVTLPPGLPVTLTLPPQQATKQNMVLIVPDWLSAAQKGTSRPVAWFLGYRTATGAYDDDIPPENQFTTNIYWWDGGAQRVWRLTRLVASVGNGQAWRNTTNQLVVRQLNTRGDGATISICRWNQAVETNCKDGLDNDCDGLVDALDPDCQSPGPLGTSSSILIPSPPSPPRPPLPASLPSPGAPDTPDWPNHLHLAPTSVAPSIPPPPLTTPPSPSLPSPTPPLPSPTPPLPTPPANQPLPPTPIQVINKQPPPLQGTPIESSPSPPPPPKNKKPPPPPKKAKPPQPPPPTPPTPPPPVPPPSQPPPLPSSSPPPPGPRPLPPSPGTVNLPRPKKVPPPPRKVKPPPPPPPPPFLSQPRGSKLQVPADMYGPTGGYSEEQAMQQWAEAEAAYDSAASGSEAAARRLDELQQQQGSLGWGDDAEGDGQPPSKYAADRWEPRPPHPGQRRQARQQRLANTLGSEYTSEPASVHWQNAQAVDEARLQQEEEERREEVQAVQAAAAAIAARHAAATHRMEHSHQHAMGFGHSHVLHPSDPVLHHQHQPPATATAVVDALVDAHPHLSLGTEGLPES